MNLKDFQRKASRLAGRAAQKGSDLLETGKTKIAIHPLRLLQMSLTIH